MKRIKVVVIVCLFSLLSMLVVQYISIITTLNYNNENREISFRSKKMGDVYSFMKIFVDIETGTRGFLLTEDQTFLEPRKIAIKELPLEIKKLSNYLSSQDIVTLERLSKIKLNHSDSLVEKKINNKKIFIHEYLFGKKAMDDIRLFTNEILFHEEIKEKMNSLGLSGEAVAAKLIAASLFSFLLVGICIFYVISEFRKRLKIEKELHVSLAMSEAISRNIDFGIIASDSLGNVIFSNKWISDKVSPLIRVEDFFISNDSLKEPLSQLLLGKIETIEEAELTINDNILDFKITSTPFQIDKKIEGVLLSISDTTVSTQKMASLTSEKKMSDIASKAKSDFVAKMSHEIRTPLNAILGVGEILSLSKLDSEQEKCLEIFKRSAITLNNLVNDILDLSKIEAGKIDIILAPFSLKSLIDSCTSIMDFRASQKGLLFSSSVDSQYDHFVGDEGRLRQIILNLLSNAIKFTEKGGVDFNIKCVDKNDKKELSFSIRDSGRGISSDNLSKLFSDYQQEDNTISKEYGGTGLGLSLSKELARLMNSDISVISELGRGSEFIFNISLDLAEGEFISNSNDTKIVFNKLKILLVDDNPENRFIVRKYLSEYNIEIIEAIDGEDAVNKFKNDVFDLVFMDINMPKKDGITATIELRKYENDNRLEKTLIIALSANALTLEYNKALAAGCDDYLTKPISRLKLIQVIKKWIITNNISNSVEIELGDLLNEDNDEEIDMDIKALVPAYLKSRLMDLEIIKESFIKNEMRTIAKLVHNIKGTASSYGQNNLDIIAKGMEKAIQDNDLEKIEHFIKEMENLLRAKDGH